VRRTRRTLRSQHGISARQKILITGLLSNRSIAYGIAQACKREGAELAFTYVGERFKDRITKFAEEFDSKLVSTATSAAMSRSMPCSPTWASPGASWTAWCTPSASPAEAIAGDFLEGFSREGFKIAHDISAYSFPAMAKAAMPLLSSNAALLTLTYLGSERVVPNYNTMGLAKASLEASVRYLAESLGPKGVRVNGVSAGPIKTLAASGIKGFGKILGVAATALAAPQCHHRRRRQCLGLPALRPGLGHHRRNHLCGWRLLARVGGMAE
jgi:enoyl-[acyl-carrier protein] reductase I